MKHLLEFYEFKDISELKGIIRDILLSEIDESIGIRITERIFLNPELKTKIARTSDFDFPCHLVSLSENLSKEQFKNISERLETILSIEFDNNFKCLQNNDFSFFYLIDESDYFKIESINEFENVENIEEIIWEMQNNNYEYFSVIDLSVDDYMKHKSINIWVKEFTFGVNKFGLELSLIKQNIKDGIFVNYNILVEPIFIKSYDNISKINWSNIDPNIVMALGKSFKEKINKFKKVEKSIKDLNLSFRLDLNNDSESEINRLLEMIREKVFPIFSNDSTNNLAKLYQQFKKLEDYNIDANWVNQGNYYFVFDINYKDKFYLLNVKFDIKTNKLEIEFKDLDIKEVILIENFSETVYLYLEEN